MEDVKQKELKMRDREVGEWEKGRKAKRKEEVGSRQISLWWLWLRERTGRRDGRVGRIERKR